MGRPRGNGPCQAATALIGMDGFVIGAQVDVNRELWLRVEP